MTAKHRHFIFGWPERFAAQYYVDIYWQEHHNHYHHLFQQRAIIVTAGSIPLVSE